ncbi:hypothetical protein ACFL6N_03600 [Thermodesulfobacteriota bacterium]
MKKSSTLYDEAHLFVAAIRVLNHQKGGPPSLEDICELLDISLEGAGTMSHKLEKHGVVNVTTTPYSTKLFLLDHLRLEEFEQHQEDSGLDKEIEDFQKSRTDMTAKVESIQAELAKKKQDLFADLEKQLKGGPKD